MAQNRSSGGTKKSAKPAGKKSDTKSRKKPIADNSPPPPPPEPPIRRELAALVFLFLAVFMVISYFNTEGVFVAFFANLVKGLIGWGFWLAPPVFLFVAILLFFHKGKPVSLRVTGALFIPMLFAATAHLFMAEAVTGEFDLKLAVGSLFVQGQSFESGGVIGGLGAIGLEKAFSVFGAAPILLLAMALCVIAAFNIKLSQLFKKREGSRPAAAPEADFFEPPEPPKKEKAKKTGQPRKKPAIERIDRAAFQVDLPLGDDEEELFFRDLGASAAAADSAGTGSARKAAVKKRTEPKRETLSRTADIWSEGAEAEKDLGDGFREIPVPPRSGGTTAFSAEISDPPKAKKLSRADVEAEAQAMAQVISAAAEQGDYQFPPLSILKASSSAAVDAREEIRLNRERLEGAIRSFGISAAIVSVTRGPTVTRYDIELDQGVKLARVTNLAGDLALALGVANVRIAPIPDKISTVGREVPNKIVSTVFLRDILESSKFINAKSKLSFALGKDIGGDCIVGNISKLPHLLIAGTTGSGKSVCMNSLILSLLYKARPDQVRLIMIDPKMVELGVYNGIPQLYVPVVTDPKKAAGALQWSVVEMLKRYRLFSELGVRNLEGYNKHCEAAGEQTLPQVVIVIDELADLMLVASKDVEESICRVAQMGRAAGMHLVIATQRPSADVITGLMKANIPSRIAFAVSSSLESRIILDQVGAEKLIGMGDMLFSPVGCGKPIRIQGAFVSDEEREEVISFIKASAGEAEQNNEIEEYMNKAAEDKGGADSGKAAHEDEAAGSFDDMLPQSVEAVLEAGSCSVSMLQRRVKLGYSRAARIVDQMEELGIVGPYEGAKPRQVVIDRAGWQEIQIRLGLISGDELPFAAEAAEDPLEPYEF